MTGLSIAALCCYIGGFLLGAYGVRGIYREARGAQSRVKKIEKGIASATPNVPIRERSALTAGVIHQTVVVVVDLLEDGSRWKAPAASLVIALVIEFAGNVLSLPW